MDLPSIISSGLYHLNARGFLDFGPSYWIFEIFGNASGIKSILCRIDAEFALGMRQAVTLGEEQFRVQNEFIAPILPGLKLKQTAGKVSRP